jgi:hypothetical protein
LDDATAHRLHGEGALRTLRLAVFTRIFGEITLRFGTSHTETPSAGLILLLMKLLTLTAAAMLLIVAIISFVGNQATWVLSLAASGASLVTWFVYKKQAK